MSPASGNALQMPTILGYDQAMRYLAAITMLVLAVAMTQPVAAQSFKPDYNVGWESFQQKDYATALRHWWPLANRGHAKAQNKLGWMYRQGWGVTQDHKQAVRWYRLAANQGDALAQWNLGYMYRRGEGVLKDPVMSYVWVNVAVANGHPKAINVDKDRVLARLNASERKLALKLSKLCLDKPASCPEYSK